MRSTLPSRELTVKSAAAAGGSFRPSHLSRRQKDSAIDASTLVHGRLT
jgi:hypothetical protein